MFRSLLYHKYVREFQVQDVLYLHQGNKGTKKLETSLTSSQGITLLKPSGDCGANVHTESGNPVKVDVCCSRNYKHWHGD